MLASRLVRVAVWSDDAVSRVTCTGVDVVSPDLVRVTTLLVPGKSVVKVSLVLL